jgi:hypothetical protein
MLLLEKKEAMKTVVPLGNESRKIREKAVKNI